MAQTPMYETIVGYQYSTILTQYEAGQDTQIIGHDISFLPNAPNLVTIMTEDKSKYVTIKYGTKNTNVLSDITVVQGYPQSALTAVYPIGSIICKPLEQATIDAIQKNITDHETRIVTLEQGGGGGGTTDYNQLQNKPRINSVTLSGNKSFADIGLSSVASSGNYNDLTNKPTIPSKTSDLTNDSGFITGVAWNDVTNKPTEFPPAAHTQGISTVTGLQTALDGKVNVDGDKVLSDNNYADADKAIVDGVTSGLSGKVDKVTGKGLSTNDYTNAEKTKLAGIADNAQVNTIEVIKVNGTPQTITDKAVNLIISGDVTSVNGQTGVVVLDAEDVGALPDTTEIPTKTSDLTNDSDYQTETEVNTLIAAHNSSSAAHADIRTELDAKLGKQYAAAQDGYIAKVDSADHVLKVMEAGTTSVGFADITGNPSDNTNLNNALTAKVDKVTGKQLSQNDYTNADKTIVDGVTSALAGKVDVAQGVAKKDYFLRVNAAGNVEAVSYAPSGTQWGSITGTMSSQTDLQAELDAKQATISDIATIRSNASAGKTHADITTGNPHNVTKGDVGLGNVNNTADADKPISTATQTALDAKVDAVSGKGLSTNDYTTAEKTKLAGISAGAEVNTIAGVQKNGTDLTPDANRKVNVTVPTALSGLTDDTTHRVVTDTQISTWNAKANAADVTALGNRVTTAEGDIDALETAVAGKEPAITKNTAFNKNFGTSSGTVCEGNDARLSDARTPTSHASTHSKNGTDEVSIDATQVISGTMDSARLPVATTSAVGGVKVDGTTITIDANSVIHSTGGSGVSSPYVPIYATVEKTSYDSAAGTYTVYTWTLPAVKAVVGQAGKWVSTLVRGTATSPQFQYRQIEVYNVASISGSTVTYTAVQETIRFDRTYDANNVLIKEEYHA